MNFQKSFITLSIVLSSLLTTSCIYVEGTVGEGRIVSELCDVGEFTAVALHSSAEVEISTGDEFSVVLSDYENLISYWDIKVVNNTLVIQTKPYTSLVFTKAKVTIVMPDQLFKIKNSGSGTIVMASAFDSIEMLDIEGSGSITGTVNSNFSNLDLLVAGSGNISLRGTVDELFTTTNGSGKMYLSNLKAQKADCLISGSGDVYVNVENTLIATIAGSGNIVYSGRPVITITDNGSGRLISQ